MSPKTSNLPYTERLVSDPSDPDGAFAFIKTQKAAPILEGAKMARDLLRKDTGPAKGRYLGTVPILMAQIWAKECGAAVGTKEWAAYAKKKLQDPNYRLLRVHQ